MAEWATLKPNQSLRAGRANWTMAVLSLAMGALLARGSALGMYPFGVAYGAALIFRGERFFPFGLLGILAGTLSLSGDYLHSLQTALILGALTIVLPYMRKKKRKIFLLGVTTGLVVALVSSLALGFAKPDPLALLSVGLFSLLTAGTTIVFWFALSHQEAVWRGDFPGEQGIAWLLILIGVVSGLQGLQVAGLNFPVILISFFILFVADRFGAGSAAGVGALLGFLPQISFDVQNLMNAGIYGLAGFCTGAFQRFGKLGIGVAFAAVTLMLTFFLRPEAVFTQIISSALGLLLFMVLPSASPRQEFLKDKPVPEVEATVNKVKALAEVLDQIAMTYQAAEADITDQRSDIPDLMNVLVERVCHSCPTMEVCWEREFYKTYRYLFDLFALVENQGTITIQELSVEWKRHCGRLKEMLLGIQFILEKEQSREAWRRRIALNQESLSHQVRSVSEVIGNFAKELHHRHNWDQSKASGLGRRHRHFLDVGIASFAKSGQGISGDNYASLAFLPTQHAFILSDGMGVGENAAKLSSLALTHLEQLLSTGFEPGEAVQALNSILVLRSPEESFVTIDMAVFDLDSDLVKLIKAGASPSYLKNGRELEVLVSSSLPAGILNQIELPVLEIDMQGGDILIMATDGVQDALKDGTDWLKYFLEEQTENESGQAQELAEQIVQEARRLSSGNMHDDGVVLVVRKNCWNE